MPKAASRTLSPPTFAPRSASGPSPRDCPPTPWTPSARAAIWRRSPPIGAIRTWLRFPATLRGDMPRCAFKLRIKPDAIEEYESEHKRVWPELLDKLKEVGISD